MAGPKFDLEWEFDRRLVELSKFSEGALIVSSYTASRVEAGAYEIIATELKKNTRLERWVSRGRFIGQCLRTIRETKRSAKPFEIIVTYDPLVTGMIGWLLARLTGSKLICEVNGDYTAEVNFMHVRSPRLRAIKRAVAGRVVRFVLGRAAGIRVLFENQLESIGYEPKTGQVVMQMPEFVNTEAFTNLGEEPVIVLVGFPFYVKGVDVAIAAFKRLVPEFPDWRLEIIGHYPDPSPLLDAIGDCTQISHRRPVPNREINEHLGRCAIVMQPSRTEAMGRVLVEAMAAAKPRVASRVGGIPTVIEDGVDGLLVPSEDIAGFARALAALMGDPGLRQRLGQAGFERARTEFAPARYSANIERLFARVSET